MNSQRDGASKMPNRNDLEIKKYLKILSRNKLVIVTVAFVVFISWIGYIVMFSSRPSYKATALLTFQDPRSMSAVGYVERRPINSSRASLIKTSLLLGQVVKELKSNVSVLSKDLNRADVFSYLEVSEKSIPGEYEIEAKGGKLYLYYANKEKNLPQKKILDFQLADTIAVNEFQFKLNDETFRKKSIKEVKFKIRDFDSAIESMRKIVSYRLDRYQTILNITATSHWGSVAAKIANTVAEKFVALNLSMKQHKTREVLGILEDQLQLARLDLDSANLRLSKFRERNPWVFITPGTGVQIGDIKNLESKRAEIQTNVNGLKNILDDLDRTTELNYKFSRINELLSYLEKLEYPTTQAYKTEFDQLLLKRTELLGNYAPSHPKVTQTESEINALVSKVVIGAREYIRRLSAENERIDRNIRLEKSKMRMLPRKELELAELMADRDVKNDIYSRIFSRYNEAKIQHEVEVSDVFIVDHATPPPPISLVSNLIKKGFVGLFLAIGMGIGLAIVKEFFDKTAKDVEDLREKINVPVLGMIPLIKTKDDATVNINDQKGRRDQKLITLDYSPTFEAEAYRDLRTKILFFNQTRKLSSFLITSSQPGDGKSLTASNLAITIAQQKISTLLIDADLRRGVLHTVFGCKKKPGLGDFLASDATVNYDNLSKIIQDTFAPNLYLITAGSPLPNPTEMLGSQRMNDIIRTLNRKFGMVVLDTAPTRASSDAAILTRIADGVILVVRAGSTNVELLKKKIDEYNEIHGKILGVILNSVKVKPKSDQYQYSYYNY